MKIRLVIYLEWFLDLIIYIIVNLHIMFKVKAIETDIFLLIEQVALRKMKIVFMCIYSCLHSAKIAQQIWRHELWGSV